MQFPEGLENTPFNPNTLSILEQNGLTLVYCVSASTDRVCTTVN